MRLVWPVPKAAGLLGKITPLARQIGKLRLNGEVAYLRGHALAFLCFPKVLFRGTHGSATRIGLSHTIAMHCGKARFQGKPLFRAIGRAQLGGQFSSRRRSSTAWFSSAP
jgi:hypothetical protein